MSFEVGSKEGWIWWKSSKRMKLDYSNINKPKDDFNLSVKLISQYLKHTELQDWQPQEYINDMAKWQSMACQVWKKMPSHLWC